jgi:hypothetical protein
MAIDAIKLNQQATMAFSIIDSDNRLSELASVDRPIENLTNQLYKRYSDLKKNINSFNGSEKIIEDIIETLDYTEKVETLLKSSIGFNPENLDLLNILSKHEMFQKDPKDPNITDNEKEIINGYYKKYDLLNKAFKGCLFKLIPNPFTKEGADQIKVLMTSKKDLQKLIDFHNNYFKKPDKKIDDYPENFKKCVICFEVDLNNPNKLGLASKVKGEISKLIQDEKSKKNRRSSNDISDDEW